MYERKELGAIGEKKVVDYLRKKGYIITKRNWRDSRYGEIDIIAENETEILFVEVRTRTAGALVSGAESVDSAKLNRVKSAANVFMQRFHSDLPYRVDVAEVTFDDFSGKETWSLRYIKNV